MPSKPVFVCSGMGQQWWAMGRELLAQEPVFRRAVEEVSDLFGQLAGWSLLDKLTADEQDVAKSRRPASGNRRSLRCRSGLAALWRSWGVEPAAVLGHSAGEMAASYISGALSLEDAVRVTFHRSRLQHRTAGQGAMLAVGISREEATRLVERHPRAISIAAVNGPNSVTLSGDAAVLAEIDKALNEAGRVQPRLAGGRALSQPQDGAARSGAVGLPARYPAAAGIDAVLLHGDRHCARGIRARCAVLVPERPAAGAFPRHHGKSVIEAGHQVFLEIGAHPILRHDIAAVLERKVVGGHDAVLAAAGRSRASGAARIARPHVYALAPRSTGGSFIRPRRRPSSCRSIRFRPTFIGGNPSRRVGCAWAVRSIPCLGNRLEISQAVLERDPGHGELELSGRTIGSATRSSFRARDMSRWRSRRRARFSGRSPASWKTSNSRSSLFSMRT